LFRDLAWKSSEGEIGVATLIFVVGYRLFQIILFKGYYFAAMFFFDKIASMVVLLNLISYLSISLENGCIRNLI